MAKGILNTLSKSVDQRITNNYQNVLLLSIFYNKRKKNFHSRLYHPALSDDTHVQHLVNCIQTDLADKITIDILRDIKKATKMPNVLMFRCTFDYQRYVQNLSSCTCSYLPEMATEQLMSHIRLFCDYIRENYDMKKLIGA